MINQDNNGRVFGDLYYANNIPTHVGKPLKEVDALGAALQDDYYRNLESIDKISAMAKNIPARDVNLPYISNKVKEINSALDGFAEKGDYENAGIAVRKLSRDFANDKVLQGIIKDKQAYDAWLADLDEKVDKKLISQSQKDAAVLMSKYKNNKAVEFNNENLSYNNIFEGTTPPANIDINKRIDDIVKSLEPDQITGELKSTKIPFKMAYNVTKGLDANKIRQNVQDWLLGQEDVQDFIKFNTLSEDFINRAYRGQDGQINLRPYSHTDLIRKGILDAPYSSKIHVKDEKGKYVFIDDKGNKYTEDAVGPNPLTKELGVVDPKTGVVKTKVKPFLTENEDFLSKLYNPDGSLNQEMAAMAYQNKLRNDLTVNYLDYGANKAYTQKETKFIDNDYGKSVALANHHDALERSRKAWEWEHDERTQAEPFTDTFFNWQTGQTTKTVLPETIKSLLGEKINPTGSLLLPTGGMNLKDATFISKLPMIAKVQGYQNQYGKNPTIRQVGNSYQVIDETGKIRYETNATNIGKLKGEIDDMTNLKRQYNITDGDLTNRRYTELSESQKDALKTMAELINKGANTTYQVNNTNNLKRINNGLYSSIGMSYNFNQLKEMGITEKGIEELNSIYGANTITKTGNKEKVGSTDLDVYTFNVSVPVNASPASHAKFNHSFNLKYNSASADRYNNSAQMLSTQATVESVKNNLTNYSTSYQANYDKFERFKQGGVDVATTVREIPGLSDAVKKYNVNVNQLDYNQLDYLMSVIAE